MQCHRFQSTSLTSYGVSKCSTEAYTLKPQGPGNDGCNQYSFIITEKQNEASLCSTSVTEESNLQKEVEACPCCKEFSFLGTDVFESFHLLVPRLSNQPVLKRRVSPAEALVLQQAQGNSSMDSLSSPCLVQGTRNASESHRYLVGRNLGIDSCLSLDGGQWLHTS